MTAIARVLQCTELVQGILEYLKPHSHYSSQNNSDLVHCARVCKSWSPIALRLIWADCKDSLRASVGLIAPELFTEEVLWKSDKSFDGLINYDKFDRWSFYAQLIRKIALNDLLDDPGIRYWGGALLKIANHTRTRDLYPAIETLDVVMCHRQSAIVSGLIINKTLRHLNLNVELSLEENLLQVLLADLDTRAPSLRSLAIRSWSTEQLRPFAFEFAITKLPNLTSLGVPLRWLDNLLLTTVMQLEALRVFKVSTPNATEQAVYPTRTSVLQHLSPGSWPGEVFINIKELHLEGAWTQMRNFATEFFSAREIESFGMTVTKRDHFSPTAHHPAFPTPWAAFQTLQRLEIVTVQEETWQSSNVLHNIILQPLSAFKDLRILSISGAIIPDLEDKLISKMARHWPRLTSIVLCSETSVMNWSGLQPPSLTLKSIAILTRHCPLLTSIELCVGANLKPARKWAYKQSPQQNPRRGHLESINFGDSFGFPSVPQDQYWMEEFASLLFQMIPRWCSFNWCEQEEFLERDEVGRVVNARDYGPLVRLEQKRWVIGLGIQNELMLLKREAEMGDDESD